MSDTGTDWAALADRLDDDAMRMQHHGEKLDEDDGCRWGGVGTTFWAMDAREAAVGLRRLAQLDTAIGQRIAELRAIHRPQWASPDGGYTTERRDGYTPVGCAECYPHDGSWPCITAMVADDLAAAVLGSGEQPEGPTVCPTCGDAYQSGNYNTGAVYCPDSGMGNSDERQNRTRRRTPVTDQERREYRQALDNLNRLIGWLEQHGVGADVAIRSTVSDHETRITALEGRQ